MMQMAFFKLEEQIQEKWANLKQFRPAEWFKYVSNTGNDKSVNRLTSLVKTYTSVGWFQQANVDRYCAYETLDKNV
jgi:hypothetical protein